MDPLRPTWEDTSLPVNSRSESDRLSSLSWDREDKGSTPPDQEGCRTEVGGAVQNQREHETGHTCAKDMSGKRAQRDRPS